ncbi:MAG TPA: radical SAM protein [Blastocatellia bacterium]|jgi:MoaA/NifB/PqqE/SkfB family radical SAM enzyme|nr:radical SAM protein [Blastocatellia bacterium]
MKKRDILRGWGRILSGHHPMLSVEITRECPLRCPGCYAYQPEHLGERGPLRTLADYKGQELIDGVLALVRRRRPLHLSIVGGEPLVRFRELDVLLPRLNKMGVEVQLVTSAVRPIPLEWAKIEALHLVVSIDGLQPDHDIRRAPATYERILRNIEGHSIIVHCTITHQMASKDAAGARYFEEFLSFWSARPEVRKIWFSIFTPQIGEEATEILPPDEREAVLEEIARLRPLFPKLYMPNVVIEGYRRPPKSPKECIFARTTFSITADLEGRITPCQFGGNPDCSQCGCIASAGLKSIGDYQLFGVLPVKSIFFASDRVGRTVSRMFGATD